MRVEQNSTFLMNIVKQVAQGEYGLAPFQRQYVWTKDDVEALMKSVMKEWPIGAFTTWTPCKEDRHLYSTVGRIGPIEHSKTVPHLILDGQNRLASIIYASFVHEAAKNPSCPYSDSEKDVWFGDEILVADHDTKSIIFMPSDEAWSPTRVPFGYLLDATLFRRRSGRSSLDFYNDTLAHGMDDSLLNWFMDHVPSMFREARVTLTDLNDATLEEARECYMTICRAGQPISDEEFDKAFSFSLDASSPDFPDGSQKP